jgi:hypothetical protein
MGLQKFRADEEHAPYANGGRPFYTRWMVGPSLALVRNCPTMFGPRTVYVTGEARTWWGSCARARAKGRPSSACRRGDRHLRMARVPRQLEIFEVP